MTENKRIRAAFYRGGTSKAVVFNGADLPGERDVRDRIFLHILGSPDPFGRQLNGMGGGLSSLSKVVIVEPSSHPEADIDYTFVQVAVDAPVADYGSTCGNMSSAVGPFAVHEGLVQPINGLQRVTMHNTNTGKIYRSEFQVKNGEAVEAGDFEIPGVTQSGAKIRLDFLDPGASMTDGLLPTGHPLDCLEVEGLGRIDVSMVDAANPVVFVRADDFGMKGTESPGDLDADAKLMFQLDTVRRQAGVTMGLARSPDKTPLSNPKIAIVSRAQPFTALDGSDYTTDSHDVSVRLISMGNFHRAITLTGAMCVAVAAKMEGSVVARVTRTPGTLRIGNPSGVLPVDADVKNQGGGYHAVSATTFRTQRRIMEGALLYPAHFLERGSET
ncbi:MAG: PrpF family protein [Alphaproteobacteria bacterium]|nr:PrpF family protein [Alphaproteobacteria bacterium]